MNDFFYTIVVYYFEEDHRLLHTNILLEINTNNNISDRINLTAPTHTVTGIKIVCVHIQKKLQYSDCTTVLLFFFPINKYRHQ